jgi:hypothetical protein
MRLMYGNEGGTMRPFLRSAESRNLEDDAMPDARLVLYIAVVGGRSRSSVCQYSRMVAHTYRTMCSFLN